MADRCAYPPPTCGTWTDLHTVIWWDHPFPHVPYFLTGKKILGQKEPYKAAL